MFLAVCPICSNPDIAPLRDKPGLYVCFNCRVESDQNKLKLLPIQRGQHANSNKPDPLSIQENSQDL